MKLIILYVLSWLAVIGCGESSKQPNLTKAKETVSNDIAPITKRLPKLGKLQAVWWTSAQTSKDTLPSPPMHPVYKVRGFAQLERLKADELSHKFQWQQTPPDWKPALTTTNFVFHLAIWSKSDAFTKDCKPQQIPGELFFEGKQGIVYFDLEIE